MASRDSQPNRTPPHSTNKLLTRILIVLMVLANVYIVWRITGDMSIISSYDAGISQRTGVGQLESFWTKYTGGTKRFEVTYEDRLSADADRDMSAIVLVVLDVVLIGTLYMLNKKPYVPPPPPLSVEERREQRLERKRRNSTR